MKMASELLAAGPWQEFGSVSKPEEHQNSGFFAVQRTCHTPEGCRILA
jgi:hypothetical protein